ncbi:hypothetical protein [Nocardia asteroides]|uniref:hypothetical protein n=1 Tax=Nocardia asteroides TaxID=1824 RepID=UPI001E5658E4|nr:hypothetical protein [Nocardia asteroides]UGT54964.1 hypothetical protein LTT85_30930 [Nocardia asteroides]
MQVDKALADWFDADYDLISTVVYALESGVDREEIRASYARTALRDQAEWIFPMFDRREQLSRLFDEAGIRMRTDENGARELSLDIEGLPLQGVTVSHTDEWCPPGQPFDRARMRRVAEVAVPALYRADYRLAAIDGSTVTVLEQGQALEVFAESEADFGVVTATGTQ